MQPFAPTFPATGLVTNEYAHWSSAKKDAVKSPDWDMTSGSLFAVDGCGYTGTIDGDSPDAKSAKKTGSAVFRLNTRRADFGDVRVDFDLNITRLTSTSRTKAVDWDGIHIWLRYQSEESLYYASVSRRDGKVLIKKKVPGGPSNGGTYYVLGSEVSGRPVRHGEWSKVGASVQNNADGSVTIVLFRDGQPVVTAVDKGTGGPAITKLGAVGIRGDNAEFRFRNFTVSALGETAPAPVEPSADPTRHAQVGYAAYAERAACPCCGGGLPSWAKLGDRNQGAWMAAAAAIRAQP